MYDFSLFFNCISIKNNLFSIYFLIFLIMIYNIYENYKMYYYIHYFNYKDFNIQIKYYYYDYYKKNYYANVRFINIIDKSEFTNQIELNKLNKFDNISFKKFIELITKCINKNNENYTIQIEKLNEKNLQIENSKIIITLNNFKLSYFKYIFILHKNNDTNKNITNINQEIIIGRIFNLEKKSDNKIKILDVKNIKFEINTNYIDISKYTTIVLKESIIYDKFPNLKKIILSNSSQIKNFCVIYNISKNENIYFNDNLEEIDFGIFQYKDTLFNKTNKQIEYYFPNLKKIKCVVNFFSLDKLLLFIEKYYLTLESLNLTIKNNNQIKKIYLDVENIKKKYNLEGIELNIIQLDINSTTEIDKINDDFLY